ncbi:Uncharacterised protein [Vibrio cholerae]|nr:Uncharacterised protein [Vibrio cholerae]
MRVANSNRKYRETWLIYPPHDQRYPPYHSTLPPPH